MLIKSNVSKQQQQISSLNYTNHYYNQNFERIFVEYKSKVFSVNWTLVDKLWKIRTMRNTRQKEKVRASADFKALIMLSNFIIGQTVCAYVHMPAIFCDHMDSSAETLHYNAPTTHETQAVEFKQISKTCNMNVSSCPWVQECIIKD